MVYYNINLYILIIKNIYILIMKNINNNKILIIKNIFLKL